MELRYGNIWHVLHPLKWSVYDRDAEYNEQQIISSGVPKQTLHGIKWNAVENEELMKHPMKRERILGIVQPGRIGDIIIVLPIAKWYYDEGYKVIWPVCEEFIPLFDYVNYVEPFKIPGKVATSSYSMSITALRSIGVDHIIDLGIGFGKDETNWISSKLHFNEWKYKEANVPFKERFNLQINRDLRKEYELWQFVKQQNNLNGDNYSVIHDEGTKGPFKFDKKGVRIFPAQGYTVFDWIGIMEKAKHLYCVDSCISNLADQLKICVGRRTIWFWKDIPDKEPRKTLGFPRLCKDWEVIE